jgi:hypothetical protein
MQVMPFPQPWETNYQRQADDAFAAAASMSTAQLRSLRPPLPQITFLPPRFGYMPYPDRQPTVLQVFGIDRIQPGYLPPVPTTMRKPGDVFEDTRFQGSDRLTNGGDPLGLGGASW